MAGTRALLRGAAGCALAALLVTVTGGGEGFWLSLPIALALAAAAPSPARSALPASAVTVAAIAAARGGAPPLPLILVVVAGSIAVVRVVQLRFEQERRALRATALRDPLTGAANRRAFSERLGYEIARHTRQQRSFAVIVLDLNGFKAVNDRFGHQAGDELLVEVAGAIRGALREQDTLARLGGDEFALLAPETGVAGGERLAERVNAAVEGVTTGISALSASVGLAIFPDDGDSGEQLVDAADAEAMHLKRESRHARAGRRVA